MNPELQNQIVQLQRDLQELKDAFYRNNFSARQDFYKICDFKTGLKVPVFSVVPTTPDEIGKLISVAGIIYTCTAVTPTWTKVGLQT